MRFFPDLYAKLRTFWAAVFRETQPDWSAGKRSKQRGRPNEPLSEASVSDCSKKSPDKIDIKSTRCTRCSRKTWGGGDSSRWLERRTRDWKVAGSTESLLERRENFLLQGRLSVLTLISVSVPPTCYCGNGYRVTTVARKKIPVILPKVQVAGYS